MTRRHWPARLAVIALLFPGAAPAAPPAPSGGANPAAGVAAPIAPPELPPELVARARAADAFPTFCSIPPTPADAPSAAAFRARVIATRMAGARVALGSEPSRFTLSGTEPFATTARRQAAPPPPMTTPDEASADAFAAAARRNATPPARPHPAETPPAGARPAPPR